MICEIPVGKKIIRCCKKEATHTIQWGTDSEKIPVCTEHAECHENNPDWIVERI